VCTKRSKTKNLCLGLHGQCSPIIRSTPTYDISNYAQEQGLSSDVGVALCLWLYARLSRNKQVKGLSIFSGRKRSDATVHLFDKYWYHLDWDSWSLKIEILLVRISAYIKVCIVVN